jgi:nitroreductase
MNAESGMVAQRCYVATAALGLGCGAALGFDATQVNRLLNINCESESAILLIFIGHQVPSAYAYDFRLY